MRDIFPTRWILLAGALALGGIVAGLRFYPTAGAAPQANVSTAPAASSASQPAPLAGSQSCRQCHAHFYELWSTSHHGLAMQPFTPELARTRLTAPPTDIRIGATTYRAELTPQGGAVREQGPDGEKRYPIVHVMGGKNIFYFLTPLERGRLQVLPVAYDVRRNEWFDTAASAMRHFGDRDDAPLDWRDPLYTFNTSCHACHVSQLSTNYDLKTDSYHTTWAEAGINCETCHGPSGEHVRLARDAAMAGRDLVQPESDRSLREQLGLISTRTFTPEQHNASCSTCHAKAAILTNSFQPGDRFFDHFDLATLEDPDFYPDGRDLGENYTYTTWRMSPCANAGQLHCVHCHTSSGRYRFTGPGDEANKACLPCHEERVKNAPAHTHHPAGTPGNQCVSCHMPMTEFGRMRRSDHSMRPPTPATTLAFKSPNACNICHTDKDAAWADAKVRQWRQRDYQAPVLERAKLLAAARAGDWSQLPQMLKVITDPGRDEIWATSFIRLLVNCSDARKWPALLQAMNDPSPLVRSAAVMGLANAPIPEAVPALRKATGDEYRLVRIRAASALAGYPTDGWNESDRRRLAAATNELEASLRVRPDDWASHYSLGNYYSDVGRLEEAIASFTLSQKLRPDVVPPLVNAAIAYARLGRNAEAGQALERALAIEPTNAAVHFNMGLLQAELNNPEKAEEHLRAALKADPQMGEAAFNLGLLVMPTRPQEGIALLRQAHAIRSEDARYAYTLAFYLYQTGDAAGAIELLEKTVSTHPDYADAAALLDVIRGNDRRGTSP